MEEITKKEKNTGMATIAYIIFFLPLLTEAKDDPFVKYHVKQGFLLFLAGIVTRVIASVPYIGWVLIWPFNIFLLILFISGVMNSLGGKQESLPVIGKFAEKFKF
jgi:uncharacterized membrane protein